MKKLFFLNLILSLTLFSILYAKQPIVEVNSTEFNDLNYKTYSDSFYGFSISYPKSMKLTKDQGGIINIVPKSINNNYRFIPSLVISKYFVLSSQSLKEIINYFEQKMSFLPLYKLNYVQYGLLTNEARVSREFLDEVTQETVYEVSVYKHINESVFEFSWQMPKRHLNQQLINQFEKIITSFKILDSYSTSSSNNNLLFTINQASTEITNLINEGKALEALKLIDKLQNKTNVEDILLLKSKCYIILKDYKKLSKTYEKLVKLFPNNLEFLNLYVDSLILNKDYKQALKACKKALELTGNKNEMAMAYINLGNIFLAMNRYNEALNAYTEGIEKFPDNLKLYNNAAYTCYLLNDINQSIEYYNKALYIDPNDKTIHLRIAQIYKQKNDLQAAIFHLNKVLTIDNTNEEAYIELLKIYKKLKMDTSFQELVLKLQNKDKTLLDKILSKIK